MCRHYFICEEKDSWGKVLILNSNRWCTHHTLVRQNTSSLPVVLWPVYFGNYCSTGPSSHQRRGSCCVIGSQNTDCSPRSLTGESWGRICFEGLALPVYLPPAPAPPNPNRLEAGKLKWPLASSLFLSHYPSLPLTGVPVS